MREYIFKIVSLILTLTIFSTFNLSPYLAYSATNSDLKNKIDQRTQDIKALEQEIAGYQSQINALDGKASSLSSTISSLELTQKKLAADIKVTENKIDAQNYEIERLASGISQHENTIQDDRRIISNSFLTLSQNDDISVVNTILGSESISKTLNSLDNISTIQTELFKRIDEISQAKADLESTKRLTEKARANLLTLSKQLKDQHSVVLSTKSTQNKLLSETKQSEAQYQKLLANKKALKDAFEQELLSFEAQLKTTIDKSKIPHTGSGVLSWPLDSITITQYFGNTDFASANPQVYNGKGHTGVDFRASIGTPVRAALSGVVSGVGNSDLIPGCYSYGKWVMVKHSNGLSTLYAHLSLQSVSMGSAVSTGQLVGYSGNTGYTTGPHLHFGVYATQGVQIGPLTASKNCRGAVIPIAPFDAYLNPLSYL